MPNSPDPASARPARKSPLRRWLPLVGLLLFVVVLSRLDLSSLAAAVASLDPLGLCLGQAIILAILYLKAVRHYYLLRAKGIDMPFRSALQIFLQSSFWGFVSPGRLGEFSRMGYLKDYSPSALTSASTVVLDRLLDIAAVVLLWLGALFLAQFPGRDALVRLAAPGAVAGVAALAAARWWLARRRPDGRLAGIASALFSLPGKWRFLAATLAIWGLYYLGCWIMAAAIPVAAPAAFLVFCAATANAVSFLPLSVAGIGTRDATLVLLFSSMALDPAKAVVFSATFLLSYLTGMVACLPAVLRR